LAWWLFAVILPLGIYLRTLCPTIFVGDSGELVAGTYCLGIVHPPGYPLYCLVGRLMALLPVGGVAQRLNLLSALCAAMSAGLVFLLAADLGQRHGLREKEKAQLGIPGIWAPALLAGLLCAFSKTLWSQAVVAEVYAGHLFLLLLCLVLLALWEERGGSRYLFCFAFVLGLALAHHPATVLVVPAFLLFLVWHRRWLFENWGNALILVGLLMLGLSVFLYLPLRALANPALDWGHPVSIQGTLAHITRASYGGLSKHLFSWKLFGDQIRAVSGLLAEQFGSVLLTFSVVGLAALFRGFRIWFSLTLCLFLVGSFGVILVLNFPVDPKSLYLVKVFFIPSFAMVSLWAGMGTGWLAKGILAVTASFGSIARRLLGTILGILIPLLAVVPLWGNFAANDRSRDYLAADLGENILITLEPDALLFTSRDTPTFSLAFARIVQGLRPDVSLQHTGHADIFRHLDPAPGLLDPEVRPIYGIIPTDLPKMPGWTTHQLGIVYQMRRSSMEMDKRLRIWDQYSLRGLGDEQRREDFFQRELIRNYVSARGNLAQDLAREGRFQLALREVKVALAMDTTFFGAHLSMGNVCFQMGEHGQAAQAYERALHWAPDNVEIINNLALTRGHMGDIQGAIDLYLRSIALVPQFAKTHNDLGLTYKAAGLYPQASEEYQRAIQLDPGYADPLRNLGVIYAYHLVDIPKAIALWQRYLDLSPEDVEGEKVSAEIQRLRDLMENE